MPINKAVLAAFKAATRLRPDIREFYKTQRLAEDVSAKLVLPNPRCRIDEAFATMPDGFEAVSYTHLPAPGVAPDHELRPHLRVGVALRRGVRPVSYTHLPKR